MAVPWHRGREPRFPPPDELLGGWELHFLIDWGHRIHALDGDKFCRIERELLTKLEGAWANVG